ERDRRALKILAFALAAAAVYVGYGYLPSTASTPSTAAPETVDMAEQRLARLRDIAASGTAKQAILTRVAAELAQRETGLVRTDTAQQAQAQILTRVREVANAEGIELRSSEFPPLQPLGDAYGLAPTTVQFDCRVEQLINVLAALAAEPELIATRDLQIASGNPKDKVVRVRLTVSAVVPRALVPEKGKKGAGL
ncbi:MAG: hypothetical protein RL328_143, partial [Acidobacteriota bacterium]